MSVSLQGSPSKVPPSLADFDTSFNAQRAEANIAHAPELTENMIELCVMRPWHEFDGGSAARHNKGRELQSERDEAVRDALIAEEAAREEGASKWHREQAAIARAKADKLSKRYDNYMAKGHKVFTGATPDQLFAEMAKSKYEKPHRVADVKLPKGATLESIRERIKGAAAEIVEVMGRPVVLKEARAKVMADLDRMLEKTAYVGLLGEAFVVRYTDGNPNKPNESLTFDLKPDALMREGVRGHIMAAIDERLKRIAAHYEYDNPIGRREREKTIKKLQDEIDSLEWQEGALIRASVLRGESILLRPDTKNFAAVLGLVPDTEEIARRDAAAKADAA